MDGSATEVTIDPNVLFHVGNAPQQLGQLDSRLELVTYDGVGFFIYDRGTRSFQRVAAVVGKKGRISVHAEKYDNDGYKLGIERFDLNAFGVVTSYMNMRGDTRCYGRRGPRLALQRDGNVALIAA